MAPAPVKGQACVCSGSTITCTGTINASDPNQGGRISVAGTISTCAAPTGCPGVAAGTVDTRYDSYLITNDLGVTACYTFTLNNNLVNGCGQSLFSVVYTSAGFQPTSVNTFCTNYLADIGFPVTSGTSAAYSLNLTAGQTVQVVVLNRNTGLLCTGNPGNYSLAITSNPTNNCPTPTAANAFISGRILTADGTPVAGAVIALAGTQSRKTITDANGDYSFDQVETNGFYTVTPERANYSFSPAERAFSQIGNNTEAAFTATPTGGFANPLDTPEYFVRQHYLDFLGREPDEAGFNFWSDQMLTCGDDASCFERRRINVSAAYFLSIEFQRTGGVVDGLYRASYGVRPQFAEFMPDTATLARGVVVGRTGWEQLLAANKQAFLEDWVQRPAFRAAYDLLTNDGYVDALIAHTGISFTPSERDALVNALTFGTLTRAGVLERIAEDDRFVAAKRNEAFVMMEYFGYLQRDLDAGGFAFWLNKLNQFGGNFEQAEMVKAFIVSGEYRERFPR